jgi:hypothetical protein
VDDRRLAHKLDFSWTSIATDNKDIGGGEVAGPPWRQSSDKKRLTRVKSLRQNKDNLDSALRQYECRRSVEIAMKTMMTSFVVEGKSEVYHFFCPYHSEFFQFLP